MIADLPHTNEYEVSESSSCFGLLVDAMYTLSRNEGAVDENNILELSGEMHE